MNVKTRLFSLLSLLLLLFSFVSSGSAAPALPASHSTLRLAVAGAPKLTPRNFQQTYNASHVLTVAYDLANTGSATATAPQLTRVSLMNAANQFTGSRQTPASLPATYSDIPAGGSSPHTLTFTGVAAGQRLRLLVAFSSGSYSASTGFYFTVPNVPTPAAPAAPTNLSASRTGSSAVLTWTASTGTVTSYTVKRSTVSGGPYVTISPTGGVTGTTYTDTGLNASTTYYYIVTAVGPGGESGPSNQAVAAPPTLTGLTATPGNGLITLTFNSVSGANNYYVYESADANAAPADYTYRGNTGGALSFTQGGLTNGTTHYYYVVPYSDGGAGTPSSIASAKVSLPAPTNLTATPGDGQVKLTFTASAFPGASNYYVYESADANAAPADYTYRGNTGGALSFTQGGLTNGTTHYYYVVPYNNGGAGTPTGVVNATPFAVSRG